MPLTKAQNFRLNVDEEEEKMDGLKKIDAYIQLNMLAIIIKAHTHQQTRNSFAIWHKDRKSLCKKMRYEEESPSLTTID